jgi:hypothetical protein
VWTPPRVKSRMSKAGVGTRIGDTYEVLRLDSDENVKNRDRMARLSYNLSRCLYLRMESRVARAYRYKGCFCLDAEMKMTAERPAPE